jgi:APA family basic amino acid/polyamine antiporter
MALSAASIFVLRPKTKHLNNTGIYSMKLYPFLPIIFIINYIFVAIAIAADYKNNNHAALTGIAVLAVFMAIYFIFYRKKKISREL